MEYAVFISNLDNVLTFNKTFAAFEEALKECNRFKCYCIIYRLNRDCNCVMYVLHKIVAPVDGTLYECPKPMMYAVCLSDTWFFKSLPGLNERLKKLTKDALGCRR